MAFKSFCSNCGTGYVNGDAYCPMCGVLVALQAATAYNSVHQAHCTGCGARAGSCDIYCAACGMECAEYVPVAGIPHHTLGGAGFGTVRISGSLPNVAGIARKIASELTRVKEPPVLIPAVVFALVALAVGLVLSFFLDKLFGGAVGAALYGPLRGVLGESGIDTSSLSPGMITTWLMTCLGGFTWSVRSTAFGSSFTGGSVSLAVGVVALIIVPVVALIIARFARKAFIDYQYPGKPVRVLDGLLSAAVFAVINVILSFFPSPLGNALNQAAALDAGGLAEIGFRAGSRAVPLFLFSLIIALALALPGVKRLAGSVHSKNKTLGLSFDAVAGFVPLALLCGLVSAVVTLAYAFINGTDQNLFASGGTPDNLTQTVLLLLPNLAVWLSSFFTGGSLVLSISGAVTGGAASALSMGALGANINDVGINSQGIVSWYGGILLLIAGLWIAVTALYRPLRNERISPQTAIGVIAVPSIVMCIISSCATIGLNVSANGDGGRLALSSTSFINIIMCAVFMALAVCVVHFTKKSRQLNNIVAKLATKPLTCAVAAIATLIMCLTVKLSNYVSPDIFEDLFSFLS